LVGTGAGRGRLPSRGPQLGGGGPAACRAAACGGGRQPAAAAGAIGCGGEGSRGPAAAAAAIRCGGGDRGLRRRAAAAAVGCRAALDKAAGGASSGTRALPPPRRQRPAQTVVGRDQPAASPGRLREGVLSRTVRRRRGAGVLAAEPAVEGSA
jgi:hypothetical protein